MKLAHLKWFVFFLLAGCSSAQVAGSTDGQKPMRESGVVVDKVVQEIPGSRPEWIDVIPDSDGQNLYFVGQSGSFRLERDARDDALRSAVNDFARYCGVEVNILDEYLAVSTSKASGVADPTISTKNLSQQAVEAFVSRVKSREWYARRIERYMGSTLLETAWQSWTLVTVPVSEVERVREYKEKLKEQRAEAQAAPFLEPYAKAASLLDAARKVRSDDKPLEALPAYLVALKTYEKVVAIEGFDKAQSVLKAKGHEFPLPIEAEIQSLLADLKVEKLNSPPRMEPGDQLPEPLNVRAAYKGRPLAAAPILFSGEGAETRLTASEKGMASFRPENSSSWKEGNKTFVASLDHTALEAASARFNKPETATFLIEVRSVDNAEALEINKKAIEQLASDLAEAAKNSQYADGLKSVVVLPATEPHGPTRFGSDLAGEIEGALAKAAGIKSMDRSYLDNALQNPEAAAEVGGAVSSRVILEGNKIYLKASLIHLKSASIVGSSQKTLRLTAVMKSALEEKRPREPGVEIDVNFLYQVRGARPQKLENAMTLYSGNRYSVFFEPKRKAYVYVYQIDSLGKIFPLFPNSDFSSQTNPAPAGQAVTLPSGDWAFELDENPGAEEIIVIASRIPLNEVEGLFGQILQGQELGPETQAKSPAGRQGDQRRELTVDASRTTMDLALDILSSPALGTVKRVKFFHK